MSAGLTPDLGDPSVLARLFAPATFCATRSSGGLATELFVVQLDVYISETLANKCVRPEVGAESGV